MNPAEIRTALTPVLGEEIARALAANATRHKDGAAQDVSIPSWVLVRIAEKMVELVYGT